MAGNIKRTLENLLGSSSNDSEPLSTRRRLDTPAAPPTDLQATNGPVYPASSSAVVSLPHLETRDSAECPPPAPILPAPPTANQSAKCDSWAGLHAFSRLVIGGSVAFNPFKEVVDGILASMETFETAAQNREDYCKLRNELDTLFHDLAEFFGASTPPAMNASIVNLARGIERELAAIQLKRRQSRLSRVMNAMKEEDMILEHYRRVQWLLERLKLNANMNMWKIADEQAM
ncbi:hypothetical protein FRC07_002723, partial [Ceratobasidium sp. 392]